MDVFEDEHRRLFARRSFDEAASREEERLAVRDGSGGVQAEQDGEVLGDDRRLGGLEAPGNSGAELLERDIDGIAVEDVAELLELRRERPVRAALPIRQRASADDPATELIGEVHELDGEPRLPDAGRAEDGDELRGPLGDDALPDAAEDTDLTRAPDHRALVGPLFLGGAEADSDPELDRPEAGQGRNG